MRIFIPMKGWTELPDPTPISASPIYQPATAVVQQGAATAVSFNPLWIVGALAVVIVMVFVFKK